MNQNLPPARRGSAVFVPLMVTNAGIIIVLLTGPNSTHQLLPMAYAGAALAVAGAGAMLRAIVAGRRRDGANRPHIVDTKVV